jgi:hypothetical protein
MGIAGPTYKQEEILLMQYYFIALERILFLSFKFI